ncbi:MAG: nucleoside deaminase [Candidatus Eisenbacteria bacterium]|uniref:Nucleoside deaminase n=1 Tax=Eiseniibacteriota bacterium TaxID=2212470 RepID=A0A7Y2E9Q6_UNCEI|nr:nucleoside deaminase [Candidatus Eisenbacteria bacterium]
MIEPDSPPDDEHLMARAVARAEHSRLLAPPNPWVGAVVVTPDGVTFDGSTRRPGGAHAERHVLARAGDAARGATMYVTLEPCLMCAGAIFLSRIERLVYAASDPKRGALGSVVNVSTNEALNHHTEIESGLMKHECSSLLSAFFEELRRKARSE